MSAVTRQLAPKSTAPAPAATTAVRRTCSCGMPTVDGRECARCRVERQATRPTPRPAQAALGSVRQIVASSGEPLTPSLRTRMEDHYGHDFGAVRVHADAAAAASARSIDARAYAVGSHIVFGSGQYQPHSGAGQWLIAHELAHVAQNSGSIDACPALRLGAPNSPLEREASRSANAYQRGQRLESRQPLQGDPGTVRRFSESEHTRIGMLAYDRARPSDTKGTSANSVPPIDPAFVKQLKDFKYRGGGRAEMTYGQLVAAADNVTSLAVLEDRARERKPGGMRVPVLSYLWDWIGDKTHYYDLASRNLKHFHPHNFIAWQTWQWTALRTMNRARILIEQSHAAERSARSYLASFDTHQQRARRAIDKLDDIGTHGDAALQSGLEKAVETETAAMRTLLKQATAQQQIATAKRNHAVATAQRAVTINGFGNHFLTDAFAGGHIGTPRADLLQQYATKLLGVPPVGGPLHCANVPSLAWHDLDNAFGVEVTNRKRTDKWIAYGDDWADTGAKAGSNSPTIEHVVAATAESLRMLWSAAAGPMPGNLDPVLELVPRPDLSKYPRWNATHWEAQLRYAAGLGAGKFDVTSNSPKTGPGGPDPKKAPNPKAEQIAAGPLGAGLTCTNLLSEFSYNKFVVPMLAKIRSEERLRFNLGDPSQVVSPDAVPEPQESVAGHVVLGSLLGGLTLAVAGLAIAGLPGLVIGAVAGLIVGGFIGGFLGRKRARTEQAI